MNFDIGLEEMLQPITKETSSRQNGVEKWNKQVFMNIIVNLPVFLNFALFMDRQH
jgi:hypothetical protein